MEPIKRQKLVEAGWKVGSIAEFLKLTPEETVTIEIRLSLSKYLESLKQQAAKDLSADRSRITKLESVDPSVSIDLLIRSLLLVGATREGIAAAISGQSVV